MTITSSSPILPATPQPTAENQTQPAYKRTYEDGNLTISADFDLADVNSQDNYRNVTINTGNHNDRIHLHLDPDQKLTADINGKSYPLNMPNQPLSTITINTNGGDDRVSVDDNVKSILEINTGDGNDFFKGGGGIASVHLGDGDDQAYLGLGGTLHGENGNDFLAGGRGWRNNLLGGSGSNIMIGAKVGNLDQKTSITGSGDHDTMTVLSGKFSINSGAGTSFITTEGVGEINIGKGHNIIDTTSQADIYGTKDTDVLNRVEVSDGKSA
ncbi:hypothetical protein SAMN04490207_2608 [Pseudomonas gessardii]|uniref:Calcium-binding protein n=1 Tax=Pseudomonas gessardii TaxID=78544 RepID=A0ABS9F0K2_9PSED|nr:hypothetical protein [Pseudomonas gessardii]MCF4977695.1 hypothetical protein [Pseudomonas gessardii]MCF4989971.1 hypothetical protein [Pseudomonas gessardii]MCF5084197.1 hypothetical protein [Pseudomonas gessardii]MCF5094264.1 hypothetical protein [Pseudomonas gessardii]MCF5105931.1 hypothetical protein [Pseudomonas gessardii]